MIAIKTNNNNLVELILYKYDKLSENFYEVENEIPNPVQNNKTPMLYWSKERGFWYEYYEANISSITLEEAIQQKLDAITAYDTSESVNSFMLDGETVWLDKATRVGLMNSTQIQKAAGQDTTTLWFDGRSYTLPCEMAIQMLSALELYALQCYNVTAQHKANVEALDTIEEVETYDYTSGYPEKLNLQTK